MIRDAHWYALANGERLSEGVVTGAAQRSRTGGWQLSAIRPQDFALERLTSDAPPEFGVRKCVAMVRGLSNLSHLTLQCQRPTP